MVFWHKTFFELQYDAPQQGAAYVRLNIAPQLNALRISALSFFLIVTFIFSQPVLADGGRIVKWKDDKGVTHYGDKIPAQYSNGENTVINKQGITVKRNKPVSYQDQAEEAHKIEQDKKDYALLSAFTSEDEIDLARDRNLQLDQLTLEGLELQKVNSKKRLTDMQKYAAGFKRNNKQIPPDLARDVATNNAEITKIDKQISERKAMMEATRKRFHDDKQRYIALKNYSSGSIPKP